MNTLLPWWDLPSWMSGYSVQLDLFEDTALYDALSQTFNVSFSTSPLAKNIHDHITGSYSFYRWFAQQYAISYPKWDPQGFITYISYLITKGLIKSDQIYIYQPSKISTMQELIQAVINAYSNEKDLCREEDREDNTKTYNNNYQNNENITNLKQKITACHTDITELLWTLQAS